MRALVLVLVCGGGAGVARTYPVNGPVLELIRDDARFAAFAARVRPDLGPDHLFTLAILDYLAGDDERALARLGEQRAHTPRRSRAAWSASIFCHSSPTIRSASSMPGARPQG